MAPGASSQPPVAVALADHAGGGTWAVRTADSSMRLCRASADAMLDRRAPPGRLPATRADNARTHVAGVWGRAGYANAHER